MAKKSLRSLLDKHKGKDYKLERQKRLQKDAAKRKKSKSNGKQHKDGVEETGDEDDGEELDENMKGVLETALRNAKERGDMNGNGEEEGWESEDEEEEEDQRDFDTSRLDDSDSESEVAEDDEAHPANGIEPAPALRWSNTTGAQLVDVDNDDDDDDDDDDDIPFSDLSDASGDDVDLVPHQRLTINNTSALLRSLASIALPTSNLPFSEHQSLTTATPVSIPDVENDLDRELQFYAQSLSAVRQARILLLSEGAPFTRPVDYFAEMVKSDEHMGKIKSKLTDDAASKKAAGEARRQRDLKRFGKQVQLQKMKERAAAKRDMLDKVKVLKRKRQGAVLETAGEEDLFDVALEDAATTEKADKEARRSRGARGGRGDRSGRGDGGTGRGVKRVKRDEKYGFGGKKKFAKSGDAVSSADMSGYSTKRMKSNNTRGGTKRGGSQRLGKSRRENTR